ncbi:hypothetical protein HMSSN036_36290 [Paenibacillus macerans]|nr:hypothetical protein HMSSN036_36290 [Paenibacillus macerans]
MRGLPANDAQEIADPHCPFAGRRGVDRPHRQKSGRGAYLCGKEACFKLAHKTKALDRALKAPVSPEVYEQLARDF